MTTYRFTGTRMSTGATVTDQLNAAQEDVVRALLADQGITVDTIEAVSEEPLRRQWCIFGWILVFIGVSIAGLLVFPVLSAREAARAASCHGHMLQLNLALLNYQSENGHFPPAYLEGPHGTPWHSWRVLVLPYLGYQTIFDQYRFDEPWNGPNNRNLAQAVDAQMFQCPSGNDCGNTTLTNYCVVVGNSTAFPGTTARRIDSAIESSDKIILLVEVQHSDIHWMEPRDLDAEDLFPNAASPRFGSPHPSGVGVVRLNGRYERLPPGISSQQLAKQLTIKTVATD